MRVQLVRLCRKCHRRERECRRFGMAATVGGILAGQPWLMIWA